MSTDILAQHPADEPGKRTPWLLVGGAGVLVLALVGGVTYAVNALSGGGTQPESALPAGAFGYLKVDLDPSAGQKVDGFRYMRKFPALREKLGDRDDLRQVVFEAVAEEAGWDDVDFDTEVAPWLGDRVAVAAYPPAEGKAQEFPDPSVVVALQVSDADAADEGLDRLADAAANAQGGDRLGYVVTDYYALLAEDQKAADKAAGDAEDSVLADDATFAADLAKAESGVMTAWLDMEPLVKSLGASAAELGGLGAVPGLAGGAAGRSTYVARFDGRDVFELTGQVRGADTAGWATHAVEGVEELPESSVVALGLADGDELVPRIFESLEKVLGSAGGAAGPDFDELVAQAEAQLGIELPDDLAVLLGDNLVAAVDRQGAPAQVGARVRTDADRADAVLKRLEGVAGGSLPIVRERAGDDLVVASSLEQAARLSKTGTLGERAGFRDAMPDLAEAELAVWLDVRGIFTAFLGADGGNMDPNLEPIEGFGATMNSGEDGSGSFRMRLVAR